MVEFLLFCFRKAYMLFVIKFNCPDRGETIISYCYIRDDLFRTQILHKSLDNIFYMIQSSYFSPVFWNCLRFKRDPFSRDEVGNQFIEQLNYLNLGGLIYLEEPTLKNSWIICSPLLYFSFKTIKDPNLKYSLDFNAFYMIQEYHSKAFRISTN